MQQMKNLNKTYTNINTLKLKTMQTTIYQSPEVEIMDVAIEQGFALSDSQQEPSPWEDM